MPAGLYVGLAWVQNRVECLACLSWLCVSTTCLDIWTSVQDSIIRLLEREAGTGLRARFLTTLEDSFSVHVHTRQWFSNFLLHWRAEDGSELATYSGHSNRNLVRSSDESLLERAIATSHKAANGIQEPRTVSESTDQPQKLASVFWMALRSPIVLNVLECSRSF